MAIKIKIGSKPAPPKIERNFELKIRKTLDGNLMIFDHADIDIVILPTKNKVLALPKETMTDAVYGAQNRLFAHLKRKGVIDLTSVQGAMFMAPWRLSSQSPMRAWNQLKWFSSTSIPLLRKSVPTSTLLEATSIRQMNCIRTLTISTQQSWEMCPIQITRALSSRDMSEILMDYRNYIKFRGDSWAAYM